MAQYYTVRQRPLTETAPTPCYRQDQLQPLSEDLTDSIYIFPTPSSAPASPSLSSEFSTPTDLTNSGIFDSRSRDSSAHRRLSFNTQASDRSFSRSRFKCDDPEVELWDWAAGTDGGTDTSALEVQDELERADRWGLIRPHRLIASSSHSHQQSFASDSSPMYRLQRKRPRRSRTHSSIRAPVPHPRIHIALLSVIVSLLSVDESTVHLLTHSTYHSPLFPGNALSNEDTVLEASDENPHGVTKLLQPSGESHSLKEGCAVAGDSSFVPSNPFIFSPWPLVGLRGFVNNIIVSSGKALRDVWDGGKSTPR